MRLTNRDKQVVKAVNDFRVMRQDQVQRLLFPSKNTAQIRLWNLWQHGFLKREFLLTWGGVQNSPVLYLIDKLGVDLLQSEFEYEKDSLRWSARRPGDRFLRHTLGLSEVRLAFALSCQKHDYTLMTWLDEKAVKADHDKVTAKRRLVPILPDAYFMVQTPKGKAHFFLEFDRGPERLGIFKKKIVAYRAYFKTNKPYTRYGTDKIRVLTVVEGSQTRANHLRQVTEKQKGKSRFLFSTLEMVSNEDILTAPIWQAAASSKLSPLLEL